MGSSSQEDSSQAAEYLDQIRRFQRKELRKMKVGRFGSFEVTGKLLTGLVGFGIIVMLLAATFAATAAKYNDRVVALGGSKILKADVAESEADGPGDSEDWDSEGDSIEFGVDFGQTEWDWSNHSRLVEVRVTFTWETRDAIAGGSRTFSLEVYSDNEAKPRETKQQTGWSGSLDITWPINDMPSEVSGSADDAQSLAELYEVAGEKISGVAKWESDDSLSFNPDVHAEVTSVVVTWDLENVREADLTTD